MTDDPNTDAGKPARVSISRLKLANFRNYESLSLRLAPSHVVLTGENGAGKTNLLEADFVSVARARTSPRGLYRCDPQQCAGRICHSCRA